jgi:hypothetical protein
VIDVCSSLRREGSRDRAWQESFPAGHAAALCRAEVVNFTSFLTDIFLMDTLLQL